jgi:hypothetical protein
MQIKADIHSKAYKRGFLKALFPNKAGKVGLSEFVGTLELAGISGADFALLHAMYKHVFCFGEKARGAIAVFNQEGKEVMRYTYKPAEAALSAPVAQPAQPYDPRTDPRTNWVLDYAIELERIQESRNHMLVDEHGNKSPVLTRGTIIDTIWKYLGVAPVAQESHDDDSVPLDPGLRGKL